MKRLAFVLVIAGVAAGLAAGAGASAASFKGVVVGKLRGAVLVAPANGLVRAFSGHAAVGARVELVGGRIIVVGRSHTAVVRGIVVRRIGTTTFLSSNRHLVAVRAGRGLASANDSAPSPNAPATGDEVEEQVTVADNGQLDQENEDDLGPSNEGSVQVQAVVAAIGIGTVTLTVNGQSLVVPLPAGLTLPSSLVGQTVTLTLSLDDRKGNDQGDDGNDGGGGGD
jgi:hypothetical protein